MKSGTRITLHVLGIAILLALLVYAHMQVSLLWKDVALRQALLQDVPARTSHTAALKKELDSALLQMQEMHATIPTSDGLVEVVTAISNAAVSSGISAQVPTVQGSTQEDAVPSDAPFSDVRIHVVASGNPAELASFLYKVEHLPYLLHVVSWKIDTTQQAAITSFTSAAPTDTPQITSLRGSSFEADIAIVTKRKGVLQ